MGGFVGFAVFQVGGMKRAGAGGVIVEALFPERFEIEKVSGVFLDRPFAVALSREDFGREAVNGIREPVRRLPKTLEKLRRGVGAKAELEFAIEPTHRGSSNAEFRMSN